MTRINCVPVVVLSDSHLLAEYKEITRPFTKMTNRMNKGDLTFSVPETYRLGRGHETFFFDKLLYLWLRYSDILKELQRRGKVVPDIGKFDIISNSVYSRFSGTVYWNDWEPSPEDMYVNMARLAHRHFKNTIDDYK